MSKFSRKRRFFFIANNTKLGRWRNFFPPVFAGGAKTNGEDAALFMLKVEGK
jgi:hypothetical protein